MRQTARPGLFHAGKTLEALKKVVWEKSYGDYLNLLSVEFRDKISPEQYQLILSVWSGEYETVKREETDPTHVNLYTKFYYDGYDKSFPKSPKGYRIVVFRFVLEDGEWKLDETMLTDKQNATTG